MPFAWAAKPVYKKSTTNLTPSLASSNGHSGIQFNYVIDESDAVIYQHDVNHLSDEDLYKYLGDFHTKDRYLNKLIPINGKLEIKLEDMKAPDIKDMRSKKELDDFKIKIYSLFLSARSNKLFV